MVAFINNPLPAAVRIARTLNYRQPKVQTALPGPHMQSFRPPRMQAPAHIMGAPGRANGGIIDHPASPFTGPIVTSGGGRTDDVPMHVPTGSYVVPADIVSHMGEGNSLAGMKLLKSFFSQPLGQPAMPFGVQAPRGPMGHGVPMPHARAPAPAIAARGGHVPPGSAPIARALNATPINASGGEYVIKPNEVAAIGDGDVDRGHKILDAWVRSKRLEAIKTLKKLPGPAQ
jgi:hypothetical protein